MSEGKIYRPDYSTANDARVHQTRESLQQAFLSLLDQKALDQITIREIAKLANVGYTTFFRHYPSKEHLLNDIAAAEIRNLINLSLPALGSSADALSASLALCGYVAERRTLWRTLLTGGAASVLRDEFMSQSLEIAAAHSEEKNWLPPEVGVILVTSGTIELLAWWLKQDDPIPVDDLAAIFDRVVITPIINPQEK